MFERRLRRRVGEFMRSEFQIKEILLKIGFVEEIRTIWGNKEAPETFFRKFSLFAKIRFNPFDSVPLATLHFTILWHHKRQISLNFSHTKKRDYELVAKDGSTVRYVQNLRTTYLTP